MSVALGILLAACGGASLALAMVVQRYALDPFAGDRDAKMVPLFGTRLPRNVVWFGGLVLYGGANGFYATSLLYGPLSLLAGVFTTLLVFNMVFARLLLGEAITPAKLSGAGLIICGVIMCIAGTPTGREAPTYTPSDVEALASRPAGLLYALALVLAVLASVAAISWYERAYPLAGVGGDAPAPPPPPRWLDRAMSVVYPGSLGLDEGVAHLTMKASVAMLDSCGAVGECDSPTMAAFVACWAGASVATVWWLRTVFTRYETTRALPVEYGAVNAASACSGLVFYREASGLAPHQLGLVSGGVAVILAGIAVGNLDSGDAAKGRGDETAAALDPGDLKMVARVPASGMPV